MNKKKNKVLKKDSQVQEFTRGYGYSFEDLSNSSNKNKMVDKTKQIGDKVWFMENNKIKEGYINDITYYISYKKISSNTQKEEEYTICHDLNEVFDSKEELIESLSK